MRGLFFSADGKPSSVALKSQTLDDAYSEYRALFPYALDVEMQDIYVRRGRVPGTREGISVFYDCGGSHHQVENNFFEGNTRPVWRAILAVWSSGPLSSIETPGDVLIDLPLTETEFVDYAKAFEADLAAFVGRESKPGIVIEYYLFPSLTREWIGNGTRWYTLNRISLRFGETPDTLQKSGCYDVDLLTFRLKKRTYCAALYFPLSSRYMKTKIEEYRYQFCVVCDKAVTAMCSKCGKHYSCFSQGCREKARMMHKPECVSVN